MRTMPPSDNVAWLDEPPEPRPPAVPIVRAAAGATLSFCLLSPVWVGVWVHSIQRRDTPCQGEYCPHWNGTVHMARRRKYYFAGWDTKFSRRVLVEVTEEAMRHHWHPASRSSTPERGSVIELSRIGKAANAPGRFAICRATVDPSQLPESFDIKEALLRNWEGDRTEREDGAG